MSGLMHGFSWCHFGYISESAMVAASKAVGLIKANLLQRLQEQDEEEI